MVSAHARPTVSSHRGRNAGTVVFGPVACRHEKGSRVSTETELSVALNEGAEVAKGWKLSVALTMLSQANMPFRGRAKRMIEQPDDKHLIRSRSRLQDAGLVGIKAIIGAIPLLGGSLASLVELIPTSTQRDTEKALGFFGDKICELENRIDVNSVYKDNFAELLKSCLIVMSPTHREEKLYAAANILVNLLLRPGDPAKSSYEELDHLVRCLDGLSIGAITVLGAARRLSTTPGTQGRINFDQLHPQFSQMEASLLMSLASELNALNLLHITEPPMKTPDYGNYTLELTPVGKRFVEQFIEGSL